MCYLDTQASLPCDFGCVLAMHITEQFQVKVKRVISGTRNDTHLESFINIEFVLIQYVQINSDLTIFKLSRIPQN